MDSGQKAEITLEELSRWTGEPVERLRQWRSRGLIGTEGGEGFPQEDVERTRLVQLFLRRGIGPGEIETAAKGGLLDSFVDIVSLGSAKPVLTSSPISTGDT